MGQPKGQPIVAQAYEKVVEGASQKYAQADVEIDQPIIKPTLDGGVSKDPNAGNLVKSTTIFYLPHPPSNQVSSGQLQQIPTSLGFP